MNYAKEHIRNHKLAKKETTTTITQSVRRVYELDAKTKGCKRKSKGQTKISANANVTHGFLNSTFLPKLERITPFKECKKTLKAEEDFYKSLSKLAKEYDIVLMESRKFEYPYNIALALWDIESKLKSITESKQWHLVQKNSKIYLAEEEYFGMNTTLYYIPVIPIYLMLKDDKRRKSANLLISVCSYLYKVLDVPYYRQEGNYLYSMVEMQKEWLEQDDEIEETQNYLTMIAQAEFIGDYMEKRISNLMSLQAFEQRLKGFKMCDVFDQECKIVALEAFEIFKSYPNDTIFRNRPNHRNTSEDDYNDGVIRMDMYISFIADTDGCLYDEILYNINSEFNESGAMEEPTIYNPIDGGTLKENNFDFENRVFTMLNNLCGLLHEYKALRK